MSSLHQLSKMNSSMQEMPNWQYGEEAANSLTHAIGAIAACVGFPYLIWKANKIGGKLRIFSYVVFGLSMIELYTVSAVYHGLVDLKYKKPMRFIDHCSVFALIAGTYTPYALTVLRGHGGYALLALIWAIAIIGSLGKVFFFDIVYKWTVHIYVAMGWISGLALKTLIKFLNKKAVFWLVAGGVVYTSGTIFYSLDDLRWFHAVFHCFILAGTVCHFISIAFYL